MLSESRALRLAFTIASTSDCPPRPQLHHLSCAILPRHTSDSSCPDICLHPRLTFPSNPEPSSRVGVPSLTLSLLCTSKLGCYPSSRAPPRAATTHSLQHRPHSGSPSWVLIAELLVWLAGTVAHPHAGGLHISNGLSPGVYAVSQAG